jgi:hypothetical protein
MKTLKFDSILADLILKGEKTSTWRLFDDKDLKAGDDITLIRRPKLEPFAKANITRVIEKPLGRLTDDDKDGHERYGSEDEMYQTLQGYYEHPIDSKTPVKVIHFKIIN